MDWSSSHRSYFQDSLDAFRSAKFAINMDKTKSSIVSCRQAACCKLANRVMSMNKAAGDVAYQNTLITFVPATYEHAGISLKTFGNGST